MVMSLPRLRRPQRSDLPRRSDLPKRPDLPDASGLISRIKLPELPDRAELLDRINLPELPDRADIAALPDRLRGRQRRTADRAAAWTRAGLALGVAVSLALSGVIGAAIAYFFDPDRGRRRRIQTADQLAGLGRRATRRVGRFARSTTASVGAMGERISHRAGDYEAPNDAALAAKVESELFRDASIEKGRMNINVENGVVVLRGVAQSADQIARIVASARSIPGVRTVRSLLHPPSEPAAEMGATSNGSLGTETSESADELAPSNPGL